MKKIATIAVLLIGLVLVQTKIAYAHISYFDLSYNLNVNSAGQSWDDETYYNYGWYNGTQATLGNSHYLNDAATLFEIDLKQASYVDISFSKTDSSTNAILNPMFSLYSGLLPLDSHDDTLTDPLNPLDPNTLDPIASPVDNGSTQDGNGHVSPARDTVNVNYLGQFNALGSWSMANEGADTFCTSQPNGVCNAVSLAEAIAAGDWSVITYITHSSAPVGATSWDTVSLKHFYLPAGVYTIAAGGDVANGKAYGINGTITYSATPAAVPLPAAVWGFLTAIIGVLGLGRTHKPNI